MSDAQVIRTSERSADGSAVLFDLDGTLTRPYFNFDTIRDEIGLPNKPRVAVLEALETMTPVERTRAVAILERHEREAAHASELWDDALHVIDAIRRSGRPVGVITRNSRQSTETVMAKHGLVFDAVCTREDSPVKPLPDPVLWTCARLGAEPTASWMVGDYLFDILSGNAAGAKTVLMIADRPTPEYADQADHVIRELVELLPLLRINQED